MNVRSKRSESNARSKVDFYFSRVPHRTKDGQVNNDDHDSDSEYQTSYEDYDEFESTQTRHTPAVTHQTAHKSERTQNGRTSAKLHNYSDDIEHLDHKFGQLQDMFSSLLRRTENGNDKGTKPRSVTLDTTDGNPHINTTDFDECQLSNDYSSSTDYNTVAVEAQVHKPISTGSADATSNNSRRLKSIVVVPRHSTFAYTPEKENLKPHRELSTQTTRLGVKPDSMTITSQGLQRVISMETSHQTTTRVLLRQQMMNKSTR